MHSPSRQLLLDCVIQFVVSARPLVEAIAKRFITAEDAGRQIGERKARIAELERQLGRPRPVLPDRDAVRRSLEERSNQWVEILRTEREAARALLRRLVGSISVCWVDRETCAPSAEPKAGAAPVFILFDKPEGSPVPWDVIPWSAEFRGAAAAAEGLVESSLVDPSRRL